MTVTVDAYAKINLTLGVVGIRADGYHLLHSVMQSIGLSDRLEISCVPSETPSFHLSVDKKYIPVDERNTVTKAFRVFTEATGIPAEVRVRVQKNVPSGAGLGGGSADAAAFLRALNLLTKAGLSTEALAALGAKVGADVPFCVYGGTALVTGIGERVQPMPSLPKCPLLLCKPKQGISTPVIFSKIDAYPNRRSCVDLVSAEEAVKIGDFPRLCRCIGNDLRLPASELCPEIPELIGGVRQAGAIAAEMSGSGSTVYGLFESIADAEKAAKRFASPGVQTFVTYLQNMRF